MKSPGADPDFVLRRKALKVSEILQPFVKKGVTEETRLRSNFYNGEIKSVRHSRICMFHHSDVIVTRSPPSVDSMKFA